MQDRLEDVTVLLVEDDEDAAFLLGMVLERAGARVEHASGVVAALKLASGVERFDLLISDMHLPDGSAADVLARWPADRRSPEALALTGDTSESSRTELEAAGFKAVLAKPAAIDDVIRHSAALIARRAG